MSTPDVVEALAAFSSCDVADALVKLKVPGGGFIPFLTLWSPTGRQGSITRLVGPAYTVKYSLVDEVSSLPSSPPAHYVDSAPADSVILISCPDGLLDACWGGLTTRRAKIRGVAGTMVDGRIRDLEELRELTYPVFARDVAPTPPHGVAYVSEVNTPVSVGREGRACLVHPGDILMGDLNGVVCVPRDLAGQVLELTRSLVEVEDAMTRAIEDGASMTEASKLRK